MSNSTCSFDGCDNASRARGWCWPHYKQWHRGEELRPVGYRKPAEERFWAFVQKSEGCWEWTGAKSSLGYSLFQGPTGSKTAYRFAYELAYGPVAEGLHIDHVCHNTSCVNPAHLRAVTQKQNAEHRAGPQVNSKTGVRGVYFEKQSQRYVAIVNSHGKRHYVGSFLDLNAAADAARAKRNELFTHNDLDREAS